VRAHRSWIACAALLAMTCAAAPRPPASSTSSPADIFDGLYAAAQASGAFADSKTMADAIPLQAPPLILDAWRRAQPQDARQWQAFLSQHFELPQPPPGAQPAQGATLRRHIAELWPLLTRQPPTPRRYDSLLSVPHRYVVPGGRFREFYYWDSYFTMLGLVRDGESGTAMAMLKNFEFLLQHHGRIPNGNRSYYLSRSQPPFFALMVALVCGEDMHCALAQLPALRREYAFWMRGAAGLRRGSALFRVARMPDGALLNRYWDDKDTPRDEAYREDVAVATSSGGDQRIVFRDLRAAAESGWDFSSRWLGDGRSLTTIRTTRIVPADLNSLLYGLESYIATLCGAAHDRDCQRHYLHAAVQRRAAVNRYLWDEVAGRFADYDLQHAARTPFGSAATVYPLFVGLASPSQAQRVDVYVRTTLLRPGGLAATPTVTGQQWDAPNGWAPHQWLAIEGFDRYGLRQTADEIARRWLSSVERVYAGNGKLLEKYDVVDIRPGGGGEYPLQDGFGWTNGVTRALLDRPLH
jgi:alpha,alpha-trehalase